MHGCNARVQRNCACLLVCRGCQEELPRQLDAAPTFAHCLLAAALTIACRPLAADGICGRMAQGTVRRNDKRAAFGIQLE
jgi:hypothetical protein